MGLRPDSKLALRRLVVKNGYMPFLDSRLAFVAFALTPMTQPALAQPMVAQEEAAVKPGGYHWLAEAPFQGPLYLIISIERQMMHVYDGDRLVGMASVSTGTAGHRTPQGEFPILQKREWHRSNLYSNAPMPFMQRLTWDGVALHAGHNPGYPASHGCIRLPHDFAKRLFGLTQLGTLVRVTGDELRPALMLDRLVLDDPGSAVVTFTPGAELPAPVREREAAVELAAQEAPVRETPVELAVQEAPLLAIDPSVFRPRLRRW